MTCHDCPNQTDEADRHAQMMQSLRRSIDKATKGDDAKNKRFHAIAQQVFEEEMTPMDRFGR